MQIKNVQINFRIPELDHGNGCCRMLSPDVIDVNRLLLEFTLTRSQLQNGKNGKNWITFSDFWEESYLTVWKNIFKIYIFPHTQHSTMMNSLHANVLWHMNILYFSGETLLLFVKNVLLTIWWVFAPVAQWHTQAKQPQSHLLGQIF